MAWHGGATGTGVRGLDRSLLVEGREGLRGRIRRRRRRGEPTFSRGRPEYPYREEEEEDWNTPAVGASLG